MLEGPVVIAEALERGVVLDELYAESGTADDVVAAAVALGVSVHEVAAGVLASVTDTVTPRPVVAVAARPTADLVATVAAAADAARPVVVLVDVRDPGNVGTIVRTAEAAGAVGVVCCTGTADPTSPKALRASAGTALHLPVVDGVGVEAVLDTLASAEVAVAATVVAGGIAPWDAPLDGAIAIVLGGEAHGLGAAVLARSDVRLAIPMEGRAESLNVAVAAGVVCVEALRQRAVPPRDGRSRTDRPRAERPRTDWTAAPADDTVDRP